MKITPVKARLGLRSSGVTPRNFSFAEAGSYEMTNQHVKQNGKLEDNPATGSPPRTTLLGTIFSPVFNFFSPANKNGEYCFKRQEWYSSEGQIASLSKSLFGQQYPFQADVQTASYCSGVKGSLICRGLMDNERNTRFRCVRMFRS